MASHLPLEPWTLDPERAVEIQRELAGQVRVEPPDCPIRTIAGGDISFDRGSDVVHAGFVVLRLPEMEVVERKGVQSVARFPYVPGLLSFREIPALLEAWSLLETEPDAAMLDGHGRAHPRRMGIACHFGLYVPCPTLGCAKSPLVGKFEEPAPERGSWTPMIHRKETVGAALRTRDRVGPIFVSPGNRMDLPSAIELALACGGGTRIPEPTRRAHLYVNELRKAILTS
jgi:deoxyribonuclease V